LGHSHVLVDVELAVYQPDTVVGCCNKLSLGHGIVLPFPEDCFRMRAIQMDFLGREKQTTMLGLSVEWRLREREVDPVVVVVVVVVVLD
jgi:hypothetical protein